MFECESDGTFVAINHISYEPEEGHDSPSMYTVRAVRVVPCTPSPYPGAGLGIVVRVDELVGVEVEHAGRHAQPTRCADAGPCV